VNMTLAGNAPWVTSTADPPAALEVVTLKQKVILSWSQFVYAEGGDDEIRIAFASHDVVVRGAGLDPLLSAITAQRVASIREIVRAERFTSNAARFISEIEVRRIEGK
jgi:hypothetical protein